MRNVAFHAAAFEDFTAWSREDPRVFERISRLIVEAARNPFAGTGKPEPLRHHLKGYWSRRITGEHRLVDRVTHDQLIVRLVPVSLLIQ